MKDEWKPLLERLDALLDHLARLVPPEARAPEWKAGRAFRWRKNARGGYLEPIRHPHTIRFAGQNVSGDNTAFVDAVALVGY